MYIPARFVLAFLTASGVMVIYMSRVALSVAIIAMVRTTSNMDTMNSTQQREPYCVSSFNSSNETITSELTLAKNWKYHNSTEKETVDGDEDIVFMSSIERGSVLSAFFYGYVMTSILGGVLADKFHTKRVFGAAVLLDGTLSFLIPLATRYHYIALMAVRVGMGMAQGLCYPSLHSMLAAWIPPEERPRFMSFSYWANCLGIIITMPVCGIIIEKYGWPYVFYTCGIISYSWVLVWCILMHDTPEEHPRISEKEKVFIINAITTSGSTNKPRKIPWKQMLTSLPQWAIIVSQCGNMFGLNLLLTQLPTYINSIIGFSIQKTGFLSVLPFLSRYAGSNTFSWMATFFLERNCISISASRNLYAIIGLIGPGLMLVVVGFVGCNPYATVAVFSMCTFLNGGTVCGPFVNQLDIAPNLAGTCLGIANTFAFAVSITAPVIVGALTTNQTMQEWQIAFVVGATVYCTACIFFLIFKSVELQSWNFEPENTNQLSASDSEINLVTKTASKYV